MGAGRGPKYNPSGLPDPTAYVALGPIIKKRPGTREKSKPPYQGFKNYDRFSRI